MPQVLLYLILTSCTLLLLYYSGVEANKRLVRTRALHRKLTGSKTDGQIEREVRERGKEQVMKRELHAEMNEMLDQRKHPGYIS